MSNGTDHVDDLSLFSERAAAFAAVADSARASDWDEPSPCSGWTARDVVDHVIDTERDFLTRQNLPLPERPPLTDPAEAWRRHWDAVEQLLVDPGVGAREYDGYFGRTTIAATMASFYGWDLLVHRWDLARAVGADDTLTTAELDAVEAELTMFGDQLYADGICARAVEVGDDVDPQTQVLALLGRDPR